MPDPYLELKRKIYQDQYDYYLEDIAPQRNHLARITAEKESLEADMVVTMNFIKAIQKKIDDLLELAQKEGVTLVNK